jgi:hypothetical protein
MARDRQVRIKLPTRQPPSVVRVILQGLDDERRGEVCEEQVARLGDELASIELEPDTVAAFAIDSDKFVMPKPRDVARPAECRAPVRMTAETDEGWAAHDVDTGALIGFLRPILVAFRGNAEHPFADRLAPIRESVFFGDDVGG